MNASNAADGASLDWLELVQRQVGSLRFGVVQIVVHESRVVQIERTEKVRLQNPADQRISSQENIGQPKRVEAQINNYQVNSPKHRRFASRLENNS